MVIQVSECVLGNSKYYPFIVVCILQQCIVLYCIVLYCIVLRFFKVAYVKKPQGPLQVKKKLNYSPGKDKLNEKSAMH